MTNTSRESSTIQELRRVLNTLSEEALVAAVNKSRDLNFDLNKGASSVDVIVAELGDARRVILDTIEKRRFAELPLGVQRDILAQSEAVAREVQSMASGTDAVLNVEKAVEDLTVSVWVSQLQNLTGHLLGFQSKMNQLKSQEAAIRAAIAQAEGLGIVHDRATRIIATLDEQAKAAASIQADASKTVDRLQGLLKDATEISQKAAGSGAQVAQHETSAVQQLASAKQAAADTVALAGKAQELRSEIETLKTSFLELTISARDLLDKTGRNTLTIKTEFENELGRIRDEATAATKAISDRADAQVAGLLEEGSARVEVLSAKAIEIGNSLDSITRAELENLRSNNSEVVNRALASFDATSRSAVEAWKGKSNETLEVTQQKFSGLTQELDELEGRIREAIEKATGYSLFHAFQKRQLEIVKSKKLWGFALLACVVASLVASGAFIYYLTMPGIVYNAAFYLKLSISVPLIYAITFCNVQYSRERKLEEEYAFKASISISLDPYQRLVNNLVDKNNPTELAKYTEFVIESIGRVFTSPTDDAFDAKERNHAEKIIAAVGQVIDPIVKLKRS